MAATWRQAICSEPAPSPGPGPGEAGSLLELTAGGREPLTLPNGESRTFLQDGDEISLRGYCEREGFARIGLGTAIGPRIAGARAAVNFSRLDRR